MKHRHRPAHIDSTKFVREIKKFPALYDPSDSEYRNMEHKKAAWRAIAGVIKLPVRDCQLRWKSLRDRFVREKKSYNQDPSNKISWPLYTHLTFLTNYISHKTRRKGENGSEADLTDDDDDAQDVSILETSKTEEDDDSTEIQDLAYDNLEENCQSVENGSSGGLGVRVGDISIGPVSSLPHVKKSAGTANRSVAKKRAFDEAKIAKLLTKLVDKPEPDEDELFFMSVAKTMKRIPVDKRARLKTKIMQLIESEEQIKIEEM